MKLPRNAVVGPGRTVLMPRGTKAFDWEIELAAVIGKTARYVTPETAPSHIAGSAPSAFDLVGPAISTARRNNFYKLDCGGGQSLRHLRPVAWSVDRAGVVVLAIR